MSGWWVRIGDGELEAQAPAGEARVLPAGTGWIVEIDGWRLEARVRSALEKRAEEARAGSGAAHRHEEIRAPMPGIVVKVAAAAGREVRSGDLLLVLEAMKMANEIRAPHDALVRTVPVSAGQAVGAGEVLIELE